MDESELQSLLKHAWAARVHARVRGRRRVGAAVLSDDGLVFAGCNIQQKYHTNDLHAEVTAIASMLSAGSSRVLAIAIVSDDEGIAPCGACRDWILEFGGEDCWVVWKGEDEQTTRSIPASELLPLHPPYS
ncbi:cytidine deaminase [Rhodococcus qingshengii]